MEMNHCRFVKLQSHWESYSDELKWFSSLAVAFYHSIPEHYFEAWIVDSLSQVMICCKGLPYDVKEAENKLKLG